MYEIFFARFFRKQINYQNNPNIKRNEVKKVRANSFIQKVNQRPLSPISFSSFSWGCCFLGLQKRKFRKASRFPPSLLLRFLRAFFFFSFLSLLILPDHLEPEYKFIHKYPKKYINTSTGAKSSSGGFTSSYSFLLIFDVNALKKLPKTAHFMNLKNTVGFIKKYGK